MAMHIRPAALIACLLALVILFSLLFLVFEAEHDCHGDDCCAICAQIRACTEFLRHLTLMLGVLLPALMLRCFFVPAQKECVRTCGQSSLIALKVKLSD